MEQLSNFETNNNNQLPDYKYKAKLYTEIKERVTEQGILKYEDYRQFLELGIPFAHEKFCNYLNTSPEQLFENIKHRLITANTFLFFCKHKLYISRHEIINKEHYELMKE